MLIRAAHLEYCNEVFVGDVPDPFIEALATLNDDKRRECVVIRCRKFPRQVVFYSKCGRHHCLELGLRVQLPLLLKHLPIEIELDCCLNSTRRQSLLIMVYRLDVCVGKADLQQTVFFGKFCTLQNALQLGCKQAVNTQCSAECVHVCMCACHRLKPAPRRPLQHIHVSASG